MSRLDRNQIALLEIEAVIKGSPHLLTKQEILDEIQVIIDKVWNDE